MLQRLYRWYGKRTVIIFLGMCAVLLVFGLTSRDRETEPEAITDPLPTVELASLEELQNGVGLELIGTVSAVSEATIQTEASGRVVRVPVRLADRVARGAVIAELENSSERAALLQAEGAYEAAVAGGKQSDVSREDALEQLENAQRSGLNTYRSAFSTVDGTVHTDVDALFSNFSETNDKITGFRANSFGRAVALSAARTALEPKLLKWQEHAFAERGTETAFAQLKEAENITEETLSLVESIYTILVDPRNDSETILGTPIDTYRQRFLSARNTLTATLQNIITAEDAITRAERSLERARIAGSNSESSVADAQIKQALGTLRAAESNLQKTIMRSPIAGTVNTLDIQVGDFVSSFEPIAVVANNDALEITTYVAQDDRNNIAVGDTVLIQGGGEGAIHIIAPAVDSATRKVEVKIQTTSPELANGDTVRLTIPTEGEIGVRSKTIHIPLTAVRLTADSALVFTVGDSQRLVSHEIEIGSPNGSMVEVRGGFDPTWRIVRDARGLLAGREVMIIE